VLKTIKDLKPVSIEKLKALAALAPKDDEKPPIQPSAKPVKTHPGANKKADLGQLNLEKYLNHYGVIFNVKTRGDRDLYRLDKCLFNSAHGKNEAYIQQDSNGTLSYCCSHTSCKQHTWAEARQEISGDNTLAPFCAGYDPDWKPSAKSTAASPAPSSEGLDPVKREFIKFGKFGQPQFQVAPMADHLEDVFKPIVFEGKDYSKMFYKYHKTGVWKHFPEAALRKFVRKALGDYATPEHITRAVHLFEDQVFKMPRELEYDPMILNLKNGMLDLRTMELADHAPDYMSRAQLPVNYKPESKCNLWLNKLAEIFSDDLKKCDVLQEFFGYCLYPKIIFPCAVFQIGVGGNGKGIVERVCYSMLGRENVSHVSMARMAKDFGPIEIKDKLLNSCGETETNQMDVTNFKKIAAGDEIQAEVKYLADCKFTPVAKHMISMNDFPGIKDKTDAFFRRVIVIEYNQKFEGANMDPFLSDKLQAELDGIFSWALDGLKRILGRTPEHIDVPDSVLAAKLRFKSKVNPVLIFVEEECKVSPQCRVSPPKLYKAYKDWAEEGKLKPLGKTNFYENIVLNFPTVARKRPTDETKEVFTGIGLTLDPSPYISGL
jgi:P4 family phage/plasmid primase-like protien